MISRFSEEYHWLSNFSPARVRMDGVPYPTLEHAFQAAKTLDDSERVRVRNALTPGHAKRLGQRVTLRDNWEQIKVGVMRQLLRKKFTPGTELAERLLATGNQRLIEQTTWHDNFWGHCTCVLCRQKRSGMPGENHLGRLLMQIRDELRES